MRTRPRRNTSPPAPAGPTRAAQYLRMSTGAQIYSLDNQAAALGAYAIAHGYEVVRTYQDAGLSGRTAHRRTGLQALLADVLSGRADFQAVLVYDVSRWGRFENVDESAHYEFVCRQEGVEVIYCAEAFDGFDPVSRSVLKQVRRVMAAEYSRHLSTSVKAGHRRAAGCGYWTAGEPGYGLRRAQVDPQGRQAAVLAHGQPRPLHGYRSKLVLGPPEEIAVIRDIYRWYLSDNLSLNGIVRRLNGAGVPHTDGRPWSPQKVRHVLTSPHYVGDQVYGQTTYDLEQRARRTEPDTWITATGVLPACVSRADQARARRKIAGAQILGLDDAEMLRRLAEVLAREGHLSSRIIKAAEGLPCAAIYEKRFGSLPKAYAQVGFDYRAAKVARMRRPRPSPRPDPQEDREQD